MVTTIHPVSRREKQSRKFPQQLSQVSESDTVSQIDRILQDMELDEIVANTDTLASEEWEGDTGQSCCIAD